MQFPRILKGLAIKLSLLNIDSISNLKYGENQHLSYIAKDVLGP
jgi:hypothetical protein